jgi:hypothetical protein
LYDDAPPLRVSLGDITEAVDFTGFKRILDLIDEIARSEGRRPEALSTPYLDWSLGTDGLDALRAQYQSTRDPKRWEGATFCRAAGFPMRCS